MCFIKYLMNINLCQSEIFSLDDIKGLAYSCIQCDTICVIVKSFLIQIVANLGKSLML